MLGICLLIVLSWIIHFGMTVSVFVILIHFLQTSSGSWPLLFTANIWLGDTKKYTMSAMPTLAYSSCRMTTISGTKLSSIPIISTKTNGISPPKLKISNQRYKNYTLFSFVDPEGIEPSFYDCQPYVLPLNEGPV